MQYHRLLLQIGAAQPDGLICSRGIDGCGRFPSQSRKGTSERHETIAFVSTAAKTYDGQCWS